VVASGGLADKFGRMRMTTLGLILSIVGSAMLVLLRDRGCSWPGGFYRAVGGLHYAGDAGAD
jgi:MFS family permease